MEKKAINVLGCFYFCINVDCFVKYRKAQRLWKYQVFVFIFLKHTKCYNAINNCDAVRYYYRMQDVVYYCL